MWMLSVAEVVGIGIGIGMIGMIAAVVWRKARMKKLVMTLLMLRVGFGMSRFGEGLGQGGGGFLDRGATASGLDRSWSRRSKVGRHGSGDGDSCAAAEEARLRGWALAESVTEGERCVVLEERCSGLLGTGGTGFLSIFG